MAPSSLGVLSVTSRRDALCGQRGECMSSPEVGLSSQPRESPAPSPAPDAFDHHRSTRPFGASDGRDGDLLTILVHFGRHLESLVSQEAQTEVHGAVSGGGRLNTYVVASVGQFATSPDLVECRRGGAENLSTQDSHPEGRVFYEQKCSPYAATRIVEGRTSPAWNELLAVPLPVGWCEDSPLDQQTSEQQQLDQLGLAKTATGATTYLALKLELVERGDSHQEDFLLASCVLPLKRSACHLQQRRFGFTIPVPNTNRVSDQGPQACIYVSLNASSRRTAFSPAASEHVEILVESFMPIVVTGSENEEAPLDYTSLAAMISLRNDTNADPTSVEKLSVMESQFSQLSDGQVLSAPSPVAVKPGTPKLAGLTPSASTATGSASGVYEWLFPLNFTLPTANSADSHVSAVDISLFATSSVPHKLVGRGHLELTTASGQAIQKDGSPLRHTVIPVTLDCASSHVLGHAALGLRWWNVAAWSTFVADTPTRRVICTNRRKRSPRPTLAWMGALLRGLNRHPVATFCDAGGVSSVLAELLAESPSVDGICLQQHEQQRLQQNVRVQLNNNGKEPEDTNTLLLRDQLAHMQAEGVTQRRQNERLQNELDTRLAAIKTCGLEIVALRREARLKDEQLQKLKEQVESAQRREEQQLAELLGSTSNNGSALVTHLENQAASQRFALLTAKYKELDREYQSVKQQLAAAQRSLTSHSELEVRHAKLQEAHLVQASLVQRLQRDKQHAAALKKAVRMQERVIRQFEQTVAQQSAEVPERPLRLEHPDADDVDSSAVETREALLHVRVQVLEQQLKTNAREAAIEMNALRMRILELEAAESRHSGK